MYDLIGDIHGHAAALEALLLKMDYRIKEGVWQHPHRKAIFVGDYIDRGPAIRQTLQIVRSMQQSGHAIALMGNHEYNALAYHYALPDGSFLREHNAVHNHQHRQTLLQFQYHWPEWQSYLQWFYTLPLFTDLPQLRAVHACWDEAAIEWLQTHGYTTMNEKLLLQSHEQGSYAFKVINHILKGKEYNIPEQYAWKDKDGHTRTRNRYKWWLNAAESSYGQFLFNCPPELQDRMIEEGITSIAYPQEAKPVFFGHYWMEDSYPVIQASNVICLDYSIAKGGHLVGYRWQGEGQVDNSHFVSTHYNEAL